MKFQIKTIWHNRKESREGKSDAQREVDLSRRKYEEATNRTLSSLHTLREQNHFAELLAESLIKGYEKK